MSAHIGVELSPTACRIVEVEAPDRRRPATVTTIRSVAVWPRSGADARAQLARLRGRRVAVVAWGMRGDHRQAIVGAGPYEAMRREAIQSLRFAGIDTRGAVSDIAPAGPAPARQSRRPVVMALAARHDVDAALRPLIAAGIRVRSVVTPAAALCSLARLRRIGASPPGIEAYVALEDSATCIALVRDGVLVAARELPWGYMSGHNPANGQVPRQEIATGLADALEAFFSTAGVDARAVGVICVCGALSDLRSMTALMTERLDVEVEPMDSMFGVDTDRLLPSAAAFRERGIELRVAWAAAADWTAPLNLLRERHRRAAGSAFARAAIVAGVGAGLSLGWALQQTIPWPAPARRTAMRMASATEVEAPSARSFRPVSTSSADAFVPQPVPVRRSRDPIAPGAQVRVSVRNPIAAGATAEAAHVLAAAPAPAERVPADNRVQPSNELGSILFGTDRKLALIDGLIVETGDEVGGARVVEIGPTSVVLRDEAGRLNRLVLGSNAR